MCFYRDSVNRNHMFLARRETAEKRAQFCGGKSKINQRTAHTVIKYWNWCELSVNQNMVGHSKTVK